MRLIDKIIYLVPDVKCSVWETTDRSEYQGETDPIELCGCLVDWRTEGKSCPTEAEINALDDDVVAESLKSDPRSIFFDPPKDSKEDLLRQLAELQAKIQAL